MTQHLLGGLHFKLPSIFILLDQPSNDPMYTTTLQGRLPVKGYLIRKWKNVIPTYQASNTEISATATLTNHTQR